jgi:3'(2'), 5'-bisphosphate nucleotidase
VPLAGELVESLLPAVRAAGMLIEALRRAGVESRRKADGTVVTLADERAEEALMTAIDLADPGAVVLGEEAWSRGEQPVPTCRFWLIDAIDGTRDFVGGGSEYTVNVGLIERGEPVAGMVLAPRTGMLWAGAAGSGAFREDASGARVGIRTRPCPGRPVVAVSRTRRDDATAEFVDRLGGASEAPVGSSLKFCMLAEGSADLHVRFGETREWDTAAGHAVLVAAGGAVRAPGGEPLRYGKPNLHNEHYLAVGDPAVFPSMPPPFGDVAGA